MSEHHDPITPLLAATKSDPIASLRARTLARAAEAWPHPAPPDVWRQVWESRPLRLAWVIATLALTVANLTLPIRSSHQSVAAKPNVEARAEAARELTEVISLPRLKTEYGAIDAAPRAPRPPAGSSRAVKQHDKENPS